jgi:hypothetical protein
MGRRASFPSVPKKRWSGGCAEEISYFSLSPVISKMIAGELWKENISIIKYLNNCISKLFIRNLQ